MISTQKFDNVLISKIKRNSRKSDENLQQSIAREGVKRMPVLHVSEYGLVCLSGNRRIDALEKNGKDSTPAIVVMGDLSELPASLSY